MSMSIMQTIREKGAKVTVVIIAIALLGFILTDYFSGKGRSGFTGGSKTIGKVNGKSVNYESFNKRVELMENNMKQQGYPSSPSLTQQAVDQTWNQEINRILLSQEVDKLGIRISKKELGDILYGPNAPQDLKQQFSDQTTGQYNAISAKQNIDEMLKKGTQEQKDNINSYITDLEEQRKQDKYIALLSNSINYPRWFIEKQNADNSQIAKVSLVREVYTSIPDSSIKIDDKEIADYISKHKDDFKQEESRSIQYVTFNAAPSASDSAETKNSLEQKREEFQTTTNMEQFLAAEGANGYYDGYINGKTIQIAAKDSIFRTPVGQVYGPYLDGASYVMAKVEGARQMPDTVKIRHILVATMQRDPQSGQSYQVRDTATAKTRIDSIQTAIRNGSNFDSLVVSLSDDPGSKDKGGVYENVPSGQMVSTFNDFIFLNGVGSKGVVKTEFGYHYIEILSQKGGGTGYKIAYLPKEIIASQETDSKAQNDANVFAGDSRNVKSFDETFEKNWKPKGYVKGIATDIKRVGGNVMGLGYSRQFVRDIYAASAGDVLKPERIDDNYVVAVVVEVLKEGTVGVAKARPQVEPLLMNKKKAEVIKKKIGNITTLEAASTALNNSPIQTVDSVRMSSRSGATALSFEPRITGAAFNPANKGKIITEALEGNSGVYVIRVDEVGTTPVTDGNVAEQRKALSAQGKQMMSNSQSPNSPVNALRNAATISDKRSERY
ncbi:MAG: SurA N-terminal domain-containing protein [Chitinophagaceae bacterium]|nr:SurA N-terminal domain-containing protein [Chitinophagaceae bacterium]